MKKRLPILLLVLLTVGAGVFYYNRTHYPDRLTFTGFVEGEEKVVKSEIAGRVNAVTFTDGSWMKQGDVLAEIDARDYRSQVAQQELNLSLLKAKIQQAENQLAVATEKLNQMRIILDKYTIRSPCDCTVQTRLIRAGEYVNLGTGIATLLDPFDKYVRIYVPVPDLGKVHVADKVTIEPDALPGEFIPGEISFIEDIAQFTPKNIEVKSDRITQVFATKVRILDQLERIKPGMEGTVYLDGAHMN